jgi:hypothetical protein
MTGNKEAFVSLAVENGFPSDAAADIYRTKTIGRRSWDHIQHWLVENGFFPSVEDARNAYLDTVRTFEASKVDTSQTDDILEDHGVDPEKFEAVQVWAKTKTASIKLNKRPPDWTKILAELKPGKYPSIPRPSKKSGRMLEVAMFDAHFGKYAWAEETGDDYDIKIAIKRHKVATLDLLGKIGEDQFDLVLLPIGQDALHIDGYQGSTTAGTPQDFDTRYELIVREAVQFYIWQIEALLPFGPVHAINCPGNHGHNSEVMLGMILEAWFRNTPGVSFDNSARIRKYFQFGKVGLGFTHGDGIKPHMMVQMFTAEAPKVWGDTEFREVHHGHLHTEVVKAFPGCTTRQFPTLCGTDYWHSKHGFSGNKKEAQALIWDAEQGLDFIATKTMRAGA